MTTIEIKPGEEVALLAIQQVERAARAVILRDWSLNDDDAVDDILELKRALGRLDAVREVLRHAGLLDAKK